MDLSGESQGVKLTKVTSENEGSRHGNLTDLQSTNAHIKEHVHITKTETLKTTNYVGERMT